MFNIGNDDDCMRPLMQFTTAYQTMAMTAGEVFLRRSMMLAHGSIGAPDAVSMLMEKATTFAKSAEVATTALVSGQDPVDVAIAALEPYGTRTAANMRDLRGFD